MIPEKLLKNSERYNMKILTEWYRFEIPDKWNDLVKAKKRKADWISCLPGTKSSDTADGL